MHLSRFETYYHETYYQDLGSSWSPKIQSLEDHLSEIELKTQPGQWKGKNEIICIVKIQCNYPLKQVKSWS